ncbi:MAG: hypothetical protein QOI30_2889 [Mycobacterium sp.]|nr:hypothetical protein [Mycobacterium sp.]
MHRVHATAWTLADLASLEARMESGFYEAGAGDSAVDTC